MTEVYHFKVLFCEDQISLKSTKMYTVAGMFHLLYVFFILIIKYTLSLFCPKQKRRWIFRCSQSAARASPGLRSLLNSFGFFSLAHTYRVSWSSGTNVDLRKYTVAVYHLGHFDNLRRKNRMASKFTFSTQLGYSRKNSGVWGYKSLDYHGNCHSRRKARSIKKLENLMVSFTYCHQISLKNRFIVGR